MKKFLAVFLTFLLIVPAGIPAGAEANSSDIAAVITVVLGKVEFQKFNSQDWLQAKKGQFLYEGDSLKSGPSSKAAITFVNGIEVKMNENSNFKIEFSKPSEKGKGNTVNMTGGQIWSKTMRKGSEFDIKTPAATVAIRGSSFDAKTNGKFTSAKCYEGYGYIANDYGKTDLKAGEQAAASSGKAPGTAAEMSDKDKELWQKDVKTLGSIKLELKSGLSPKPNESFGLDIYVQNEYGETFEDFAGVINLFSNNRDISFSGDNQNWKDRLFFKLKKGRGGIYAKAVKSGVFVVSAESAEDVAPVFLRVSVSAREVQTPGEKTLQLDVSAEDGSVKTLEIKLRK